MGGIILLSELVLKKTRKHQFVKGTYWGEVGHLGEVRGGYDKKNILNVCGKFSRNK